VSKFQHHTELCFKCSIILVSSSNLSPIFLLNTIFAMTILDSISHVHLASFDISYPKLSFIAPKISLPCSQQPTTDPYSDQANPVIILLTYLPTTHFNNIFPYTGSIFYLTSTTYHLPPPLLDSCVSPTQVYRRHHIINKCNN